MNDAGDLDCGVPRRLPDLAQARLDAIGIAAIEEVLAEALNDPAPRLQGIRSGHPLSEQLGARQT